MLSDVGDGKWKLSVTHRYRFMREMLPCELAKGYASIMLGLQVNRKQNAIRQLKPFMVLIVNI
jgi:hypothetical protein